MSAAEQQQVLMYRSRVVMAVVASSAVAPLVSVVALTLPNMLRDHDGATLSGVIWMIRAAMGAGLPIALIVASIIAYLSRRLLRRRDRRIWVIVPLVAALLGALCVHALLHILTGGESSVANALASGAVGGFIAGMCFCFIALHGPVERYGN
jgi:MFS family permease